MDLTKGWIYCLHDLENNICRIGQTRDRGLLRIMIQIKYYPFKIAYHTFPAESVNHAEMWFHNRFKTKKRDCGSDWFNITASEFIAEQSAYLKVFLKDYQSLPEWRKKVNPSPYSFNKDLVRAMYE